MMSASTTRSAPRSAPSDHEQLRLRLKPRGGPVSGFVDGGWWPRSRDLPAELPALLAVLAIRIGPVERVSYHLEDWGPVPRRITVDGRLVRLAGYRSQHPATIDVLSARHRVTLLVVAPETTAHTAHGVLMAAGRRANTDDIDALLLTRTADSAGVEEAAQQRWGLDGGPAAVGSSGNRLVSTPNS